MYFYSMSTFRVGPYPKFVDVYILYRASHSRDKLTKMASILGPVPSIVISLRCLYGLQITALQK